jgi:aminoglycoside phosphotransferase (APT) family kinase protein
MLREAHVLRQLSGRARVPRVLAVCEDVSVIGAPFYVMAEIDGQVMTTYLPAALDTPDQRRRISEELVDALVEIHEVDWRAAGLDGVGRTTTLRIYAQLIRRPEREQLRQELQTFIETPVPDPGTPTVATSTHSAQIQHSLTRGTANIGGLRRIQSSKRQ